MENEEKIAKMKPEEYQGIYGVTKETFDAMLEVLEAEYLIDHQKGGRPPKLTVLDRLIIMLQYYREYRTMRHIAHDYGVKVSRIFDAIKWSEETLIKSKKFHLRSRKELTSNPELETVIVDATECEVERPKKTASVLFRKEKEAYYKNSDCS